MEEAKRLEDDEPVCYCRNCLGLGVIYIGEQIDNILCCRDCGSLDIDFAFINDWASLYKNKYGHYFIEENGRKED